MELSVNGYTVRVLKASRLATNQLKNAMRKKIIRGIQRKWETFDNETEAKLKEIENMNLSFEHEIFRTRVSHTIEIGDASFTYANIFEIGLITKGK